MEASYDLGIFLAERSKAIAQLVQSIGTNWSHGSAVGTNTTQKRIVLEEEKDIQEEKDVVTENLS